MNKIEILAEKSAKKNHEYRRIFGNVSLTSDKKLAAQVR